MTLGLTGLRDLFPPHALFSAHDVPRPKSDPALFRHAAATMNTEPAACVVIENTPSGSLPPPPLECERSAIQQTATRTRCAALAPKSSARWRRSQSC